MNYLHIDRYAVLLALCAAGVLACLAYLLGPVARRRGLDLRTRWVAKVAEPVILLLMIPVLVGWPLIAPKGLGSLSLDLQFFNLNVTLWLVCITALGFTWILATRLIASRAGVLMTFLGSAVAVFGYLWWTILAGKLQALHANDPLGVYSTQWFVPSGFMAIRIFAWALMVLLGALYTVRNKFTWFKYVAASLIAGWLSCFLLMPFWTWVSASLAIVAFTAFAALLVALPLQREALERLLGFPLRRNGVMTNALPATTEGALIGHGALLLLAGFVACSAAVNYFEREQVRMFVEASGHTWHSAAEVNAYDGLKRIFAGGPDGLLDTLSPPARLNYEKQLYKAELTSGTRAAILAADDWEYFRSYTSQLRSYTDAMEEAARADYLEFPNSATMLYSRFDELSSLLGVRSQLAIHEGRTLDGVNDIKTVYNCAGLLNNNPWVAAQLSGFRLRQVANGSAYNALQQLRTDEQGLQALASAMDVAAPRARTGVDWEALRRGEAGVFSPIVPNADFLIGPIDEDVSLAVLTYRYALLHWVNFDLVRLAVALELYKLQNATYPADLQEITPGYLKRLPMDPIEGKPYQYRLTKEGEYELRAPSVPESWIDKNSAVRPFTFPLSQAGRNPVK